MTDKTKMSNLESYTELSIQIAVLQASVDKILQLLMQPQKEITIDQDIRFVGAPPGHGATQTGVIEFLNIPPQWPNESRTDYLKRIGQYVEAQSDNENFEDSYK